MSRSPPGRSDNRFHFSVVDTIIKACARLEAKPQTISTAASLYHRFFQECSVEKYDAQLIAATSTYLAGKVEEDHFRIRDIVNVFYKTLHPNSEPLELDEDYFLLRDSIVQGELLMLRMLKFQVSIEHPHKYLLHYLKSLHDWLDPEVFVKYPIVRTCWSLLTDYYHDPVCLKHKAPYVAVAIVNVALQIYGLTVPFSEEAVLSWYETFCEGLTRDLIWEIMEDLLDIYEKEPEPEINEIESTGLVDLLPKQLQ